MKTLDRYIIRLFLTNLCILFAVVMGLVVLLDLILNFDDFIRVARAAEGPWWERAGATVAAVADFYLPLLSLLYGYLVGLLPLAAAGFTFATLIQKRELTAMLAGGVSMHRIAMPLFVITLGANLVMVANQELVVPRLIHQLSRSQSDLHHGGGRSIRLRFAPDGSGSLFTSPSFDTATNTLSDVTILRRGPTEAGHYGRAVERITAARATWDEGAGGWRLAGGVAVRREGLSPGLAMGAGGGPGPGVGLDAAGTPGLLAPLEPPAGAFTARRTYPVDFVASDLDPLTILLRERARFSQLLSLRQLEELMERPQIVDANQLQRIRHSRFSMLVMNMLILAMGLPCFMLRAPSGLMGASVRAAVLCGGAWAGGFLMLMIGGGPLPPVAMAWLPVALYLPVAFYMLDTVET